MRQPDDSDVSLKEAGSWILFIELFITSYFLLFILTPQYGDDANEARAQIQASGKGLRRGFAE